MAKRMMADVFWDAANKHLATEPIEDPDLDRVHKWACWAVDAAMEEKRNTGENSNNKAYRLFKELGMKSRFGFDNERHNDPQGVRYMWLLLAMHVAEDEGLTP
jgi:hypothetical protein